MRRVCFLILIKILAFSLKAQYTITSASDPAVGDMEDYKNISSAVSLGASGTGQTWNYSSATISTVTAYSSTFVPMSSVPNSTFFTGGTIGAQYGTGSYDVYSNNSAKIEKIGIYLPPSISHSDPERIHSLPFSYGNTFTDTYAFGPVSATCVVTGDGTGTLLLPGALTYFNVLKIRYSTYKIILGIGPTPPSTVNVVEDRYYSSANKFYLLSVTQQTTQSSTSTTYTQTARINNIIITQINESETRSHEFSIFPNPNVIGDLNLQFTLNDYKNCELIMYNSLGQLVKSMVYSDLSPGINQKSLDLRGLESGIYYLKLKTPSREYIQKVAISR